MKVMWFVKNLSIGTRPWILIVVGLYVLVCCCCDVRHLLGLHALVCCCCDARHLLGRHVLVCCCYGVRHLMFVEREKNEKNEQRIFKKLAACLLQGRMPQAMSGFSSAIMREGGRECLRCGSAKLPQTYLEGFLGC